MRVLNVGLKGEVSSNETGNRKQETGNRKQETGNRKQETRYRKTGWRRSEEFSRKEQMRYSANSNQLGTNNETQVMYCIVLCVCIHASCSLFSQPFSTCGREKERNLSIVACQFSWVFRRNIRTYVRTSPCLHTEASSVVGGECTSEK